MECIGNAQDTRKAPISFNRENLGENVIIGGGERGASKGILSSLGREVLIAPSEAESTP